MAFIYCKNCNWTQDDFWSENGYHPLEKRYIDFLTQKLFETEVISINENGKQIKTSGKTFVAQELEKIAKSIKNMHYIKELDFMKSSKTCPECGSKNIEID